MKKNYKKEALIMGLMITLMMVMWARGQSDTKAPTMPSCNIISTVRQLTSCVRYVSLTKPSEDCCNAMQGMELACVCMFLNMPPINYFDHSKVLAIPKACNLANTTCPTNESWGTR